MDFKQLIAKLGRNGLVIAIGGLLAIIVSLFPWYGFTGKTAAELKSYGIKTSASAWDAGIGAWFPMLLLFALSVVVVLVALDRLKQPPLFLATIETGAALFATIIVLLRWVTYPSGSGFTADFGALWGTYLGVIIAIVVTVFSYLDFTAKGGDIKNLGAGFKSSSLPPGEG
jgi:hypothetical protein